MIPKKDVSTEIFWAAASDSTTLGGTDNLRIELIQEEFVPSPTVDWAALQEANFTGYGAITGTSSITGLNPLTSAPTITVSPPVGGWFWKATNATNLPQTIFGWRVFNVDAGAYVAGQHLDVAQQFVAAFDQLTVAKVEAELVAASII